VPRLQRPLCAARLERAGKRGGKRAAGPSTSTGPGWMTCSARVPLLLGVHARCGRQLSSMLLSFERPAPAGHRGAAQRLARPADAEAGRRSSLLAVLENCTEATSAATKRRLKNGYHRARTTTRHAARASSRA
jgi:hypothetical protein